MITKITVFFCTFFFVAQAFGQAQYYITSQKSQLFHDDNLHSVDSTIYSYDDQERLVLEESLSSRKEYSYEDNFVTIDIYYVNELYFRLVRELNVDGFINIETRYRYSSSGVIISDVDSTFRNPVNQILRSVEYTDYGNGLEKTNENFTTYTDNGRIKTSETLLFVNGEIITTIIETYDYNSEGTLEQLIYKTDEIIEDYQYSDTTYYYYNNGELESTLKRDYGIEGFNYCQLEEFEIVGDFHNGIRSIAYDLDCNDYITEGKTTYTLNDDIYLGFESRSWYNYDEVDETFVVSWSLNYEQEGSLGDDEISLNSVFIIYENGEGLDRNETEVNYRKSGAVGNSNTSLEEEMLIFPNNTSQNSTVNYKVEDVAYNKIKIVDFTGQTMLNEPVVDKRNLFFTAPTTSGMYFVQLLNGKVPVTKPAKLIVK